MVHTTERERHSNKTSHISSWQWKRTEQAERICKKRIIHALLVHLLAVFSQQIVREYGGIIITSVFFWLRDTSDSPLRQSAEFGKNTFSVKLWKKKHRTLQSTLRSFNKRPDCYQQGNPKVTSVMSHWQEKNKHHVELLLCKIIGSDAGLKLPEASHHTDFNTFRETRSR